MKKNILLISTTVLLSSAGVYSQEIINEPAYSSEIQLVTDNDNYLLNMTDGYYTNGFYLSYSFINYDQNRARKIKPKTSKIIYRFESGQMIFNPQNYDSYANGNVDRPYAGYLFGKMEQTRFFRNENLFSVGLSLGIIGEASLARKVQIGYHKLLGIHHLEGWETQLNNSMTVNGHFKYVQHLIGRKTQPKFDLSAEGNLNAGTAFDNLSAGWVMRLGKLERNDQSALWHSRLNKIQTRYARICELFLFFQPELFYQIYDASLQGGMFLKNKGPIT